MLRLKMIDDTTPEQIELTQRARDYADLKTTPGWKRVCEFIRDYCDAALGAIRDNHDADAQVAFALHLAWRERVKMRDQLESEIQGSIDARRQMVRESLDKTGMRPEMVDAIIESEEFHV